MNGTTGGNDPTIESVDAWEVLDSRGDPTIRVRVRTAGGEGTFAVPSGASTGRHEAIEIRDGDDRYGGRGVTGAVRAVREELAPAVVGRDATTHRELDATLVECDGTDDLSRLGANAVLGVSGAVARAAAATLDRPLFRYLAPDESGDLPLPMVNVLSGGLHAAGDLEIQDFLVVPAGAETYSEAIETVWRVRDATRERIEAEGHRPLVADEGGFSPPLDGIEAAFELLADATRDAGYRPAADDVAFAVDVAATHFYDEARDRYVLDSRNETRTTVEMVELVVDWVERYPVVSIEDPLAEDDWRGWQQLSARLAETARDVQLLGDDLLVTDEARLERAIADDAANAILVKPNQAGTLTRAIDVVERAHDAGVAPVVSARSGETCDSTIADLAVALDAGQIKIGSLARSERLAKYNRLFGIEHRHSPGFAGATGLVR